MSKSAKILILIIVLLVIAVIGAYLNSLGFFKSFNQPLNKLVAGEPDKTCNVDSDCIIRETECSVCSNGDVVNKDWKPFCPFKRKGRELVDCMPAIWPRDVRCVQGQCQSEFAQDDIQNFEDCERAGYPVMESYPRQCRTPDGMLFAETITQTKADNCGDGVCQEGACAGFSCRRDERDPCPQDCVGEYPGKLLYRMEPLLFDFVQRIQKSDNHEIAYTWARDRGVVVRDDGMVSVEILGNELKRDIIPLESSVEIASYVRSCGGVRDGDFLLEYIVDAWIPAGKLIECALGLPDGWYLRRVNLPVADS